MSSFTEKLGQIPVPDYEIGQNVYIVSHSGDIRRQKVSSLEIAIRKESVNLRHLDEHGHFIATHTTNAHNWHGNVHTICFSLSEAKKVAVPLRKTAIKKEIDNARHEARRALEHLKELEAEQAKYE